jgi:cation:H+ antiporter
MDIVIFCLGLVALVLGAELLVRGSSKLALSLGVSPLVVGLTIVAFGTSAPELAVAVGSALNGKTDVAIGNVVGSNICNVLLILGSSALITPLTVHAQILRQEVPIMISVSLLLLWFAADARISMLEAGVFLALLASYTVLLIQQSRRETIATKNEFAESMPKRSAWDDKRAVQFVLMAAGLALLVLGAEWIVTAAVSFAQQLGVSDLVIGLTIVAVGTSLPEVATSIMAAIRGQRDIAVGNVIGSSTFNILGCLGATGVAAQGNLPLSETILAFDLPVMVGVMFLSLPVFLTGRRIGRWEGFFFLCGYACYVTWSVLAAKQNAALPTFRWVLTWVALPIAAVLLAVSLLPTRKRPAV